MAKSKKTKAQRVAVGGRALLARINRKLAPEDKAVRTSRSDRMRSDVGEYYLLLTRMNAIGGHDIDIEDFGRKLGVLKPWEELRD